MSVNSVFAGRYKLLQCTGVAGNVELWKAEDVKTNDIVALKCCIADSDTFSHAQLLKEFMVLTQIRHPNLLTPLHYDDFNGQPYLVFPYTEGNSLKHFMQSNAVMDESSARKMMLAVSKALAALHENQIHHRNINPANVFVLNELYLLGPFKRQSEAVNTPDMISYLAPELINSEAAYSVKSDIYSLGAIVYECCTHKVLPLSNNNAAQIKLPDSFSDSFKQLLAGCLSAYPELRPSATGVINMLESKASSLAPKENIIAETVKKEPLPDSKSEAVVLVNNASPDIAILESKDNDTVAEKKTSDKKKVNRLLAALCILLLCFIGFAKVFSSMNNNTEKPQVADVKEKIKVSKETEEEVELPSRYLNINSLQPDTFIYDSDISVGNISNSESMPEKATVSPKRLIAFKDADGNYGFKDKDNKTVIMPAYDDVFEFSEGLAAVKVNGLWGYIDMKGNWVIKARYNKPGIFSEGRAKVEQEGNVMFINKSGTCVGGCIIISHLN
jgi:serine/threonine protein kinase